MLRYHLVLLLAACSVSWADDDVAVIWQDVGSSGVGGTYAPCVTYLSDSHYCELKGGSMVKFNFVFQLTCGTQAAQRCTCTRTCSTGTTTMTISGGSTCSFAPTFTYTAGTTETCIYKVTQGSNSVSSSQYTFVVYPIPTGMLTLAPAETTVGIVTTLNATATLGTEPFADDFTVNGVTLGLISPASSTAFRPSTFDTSFLVGGAATDVTLGVKFTDAHSLSSSVITAVLRLNPSPSASLSVSVTAAAVGVPFTACVTALAGGTGTLTPLLTLVDSAGVTISTLSSAAAVGTSVTVNVTVAAADLAGALSRTVYVRLLVTDSVGGTSVASTSPGVIVYANPTAVPFATPLETTIGAPVTLSWAVVVGGAPGSKTYALSVVLADDLTTTALTVAPFVAAAITPVNVTFTTAQVPGAAAVRFRVALRVTDSLGGVGTTNYSTAAVTVNPVATSTPSFSVAAMTCTRPLVLNVDSIVGGTRPLVLTLRVLGPDGEIAALSVPGVTASTATKGYTFPVVNATTSYALQLDIVDAVGVRSVTTLSATNITVYPLPRATALLDTTVTTATHAITLMAVDVEDGAPGGYALTWAMVNAANTAVLDASVAVLSDAGPAVNASFTPSDALVGSAASKSVRFRLTATDVLGASSIVSVTPVLLINARPTAAVSVNRTSSTVGAPIRITAAAAVRGTPGGEYSFLFTVRAASNTSRVLWTSSSVAGNTTAEVELVLDESFLIDIATTPLRAGLVLTDDLAVDSDLLLSAPFVLNTVAVVAPAFSSAETSEGIAVEATLPAIVGGTPPFSVLFTVEDDNDTAVFVLGPLVSATGAVDIPFNFSTLDAPFGTFRLHVRVVDGAGIASEATAAGNLTVWRRPSVGCNVTRAHVTVGGSLLHVSANASDGAPGPLTFHFSVLDAVSGAVLDGTIAAATGTTATGAARDYDVPASLISAVADSVALRIAVTATDIHGAVSERSLAASTVTAYRTPVARVDTDASASVWNANVTATLRVSRGGQPGGVLWVVELHDADAGSVLQDLGNFTEADLTASLNVSHYIGEGLLVAGQSTRRLRFAARATDDGEASSAWTYSANFVLTTPAPAAALETPAPITPEDTSLPWWVYLVIALGALLCCILLLLLLLFLKRRRSESKSQEEAAKAEEAKSNFAAAVIDDSEVLLTEVASDAASDPDITKVSKAGVVVGHGYEIDQYASGYQVIEGGGGYVQSRAPVHGFRQVGVIEIPAEAQQYGSARTLGSSRFGASMTNNGTGRGNAGDIEVNGPRLGENEASRRYNASMISPRGGTMRSTLGGGAGGNAGAVLPNFDRVEDPVFEPSGRLLATASGGSGGMGTADPARLALLAEIQRARDACHRAARQDDYSGYTGYRTDYARTDEWEAIDVDGWSPEAHAALRAEIRQARDEARELSARDFLNAVRRVDSEFPRSKSARPIPNPARSSAKPVPIGSSRPASQQPLGSTKPALGSSKPVVASSKPAVSSAKPVAPPRREWTDSLSTESASDQDEWVRGREPNEYYSDRATDHGVPMQSRAAGVRPVDVTGRVSPLTEYSSEL